MHATSRKLGVPHKLLQQWGGGGSAAQVKRRRRLRHALLRCVCTHDMFCSLRAACAHLRCPQRTDGLGAQRAAPQKRRSCCLGLAHAVAGHGSDNGRLTQRPGVCVGRHWRHLGGPSRRPPLATPCPPRHACVGHRPKVATERNTSMSCNCQQNAMYQHASCAVAARLAAAGEQPCTCLCLCMRCWEQSAMVSR